MTSHTPIRPTRIRIPRRSIARWRTPVPGARLRASPSIQSMLQHPSRSRVCVFVYVCTYIRVLSRRTSHRRLQHEGSGAKFPANPTNLSQPNIGCWWILIPSTRRTISHLYTDLAQARERAPYPLRLFSPTFPGRMRNARCSLFLSVSVSFFQRSLLLRKTQTSCGCRSIREGLGRLSSFNTRRTSSRDIQISHNKLPLVGNLQLSV